jgi:hypothetical protein
MHVFFASSSFVPSSVLELNFFSGPTPFTRLGILLSCIYFERKTQQFARSKKGYYGSWAKRHLQTLPFIAGIGER